MSTITKDAVFCGWKRRALKSLIICMIGVFAIVTTPPAWSLEQTAAEAVISPTDLKAPLTTSLPPVQAVEDPCLSLLNKVRHTPSTSASVSRLDRNQRAAGNAAVLGLVFGVRFALGPTEKSRTKNRNSNVTFDVWQPAPVGQDTRALAVSAYRQCKKKEALNAINEWRWTR